MATISLASSSRAGLPSSQGGERAWQAGSFTYQQLRPTSILNLPDDAKIGSPFGLVQAWGMANGVFYMVVNPSNSLTKDKNLKRLVLIIRSAFSDVDKMTDKNIKTSQAYTILDGFMTLATQRTHR